jgi:pimeloyl-ACP methyl ester carboxylesterase
MTGVGRPVVLVHGFLASAPLMWPLATRLADRGRQVFTPGLSAFGIRDVRAYAGVLDAEIDRVRHRSGVDRVDLVAVSLGGLVALWWAHHRDGWARVGRVCTVGSPVRGTWMAALGVPALGAWSAGIWQLLPSSSVVAEIAGPLPEGARVSTVSIEADPLSPPDRCRVDGADNRVVREGIGPLSHQWLLFSPGVAREVLSAVRVE